MDPEISRFANPREIVSVTGRGPNHENTEGGLLQRPPEKAQFREGLGKGEDVFIRSHPFS